MNKLQWGFKFDPGACIQCLGCEAAAKLAARPKLHPLSARHKRLARRLSDVRCTPYRSLLHCAHPAAWPYAREAITLRAVWIVQSTGKNASAAGLL
jgi:Fe-S-cluster-containing dehydrogenase component